MENIERFKIALKANWGNNKASMARSLGVTPRAVHLWLKGDRKVQEPVVRLAELLARLGEK